MDSIRVLLQQIAVNHDFARLEQLRESAVWNEWSQEARHALALLFADYAASSLSGARLEETFALAQSLAPDCPLLAIRRATMLSARYKDIQALEQAHLSFKQAYQLDPTGALISWEAWANTLRHLATLKKESKYAQKALIYYTKARQATNDPKYLGPIYYHMALCHCLLGELSEEASEYLHALNILEQAQEARYDSFSIQFLYSTVLATLGKLLERQDLPQLAIQLMIEVLKDLETDETGSSYEEIIASHRFIATQAAVLYKQHYDTAFFSLAYHHFNLSLQLEPDRAVRHLEHVECAQFLLFVGQVSREIDVLEKACAHFEKGGIAQAPSQELLQWAEAEWLAGDQTDRVHLLHAAQKKVALYLEVHPLDPRARSLHASILTALAHYFVDSSRFEAALSILKETLESHPSLPFLWAESAQAYLGLGELTRDIALFKKACHACRMVLECGGEETLYVYNDCACALLRIGELSEDDSYIEESVKTFETALAIGEKTYLGGKTPTDCFVDCLYSYGCALDYLGDCSQNYSCYEKAINTLSNVLIARPDHPHARYNLAICLSHLGEATQEIEPLHKAIDLFTFLAQEDPEDETVWQEWGIALMHLAEILQDPGRPEESQSLLYDAETKLLQAASLGNSRSYYYLACIHSLLQNKDMALYHLQRAAQEKCLPPLQQLEEEEWLSYLRNETAFHALLSQFSIDKRKDDMPR